ncbi:MAG: 3-dehydroquinate synthase [Phycisphaerales bacterium]
MSNRVIRVTAASKAYDVVVGRGLFASLGERIASLSGSAMRRAFMIFDDNLPPAVIDACRASLQSAGLTTACASLQACETNKVLREVERLCHLAAEARLDRHDVVIALGGGITGDVGGFVAATFQRGLRVIQCPTTLLAMVDASVGGKTGVNLLHEGTLLKNYVGCFHQPELVLASIETLDSLPEREFRAGLAECIKHAMLSIDWGDPRLWDWTEENIARVLERDTGVLTDLVARNVAVKACVVGRDERELDESGGRALLNLGHTFAHAIETIPTLSPTADPADAPLLHGEAVALGLRAACATACALGLLGASDAERLTALLKRAGLPVHVRNLPPTEQLLDRMSRDKKAKAGALRLVVPTSLGRARLVHSPDPGAIAEGFAAICER